MIAVTHADVLVSQAKARKIWGSELARTENNTARREVTAEYTAQIVELAAARIRWEVETRDLGIAVARREVIEQTEQIIDGIREAVLDRLINESLVLEGEGWYR